MLRPMKILHALLRMGGAALGVAGHCKFPQGTSEEWKREKNDNSDLISFGKGKKEDRHSWNGNQ